jgi:hypothetical protein
MLFLLLLHKGGQYELGVTLILTLDSVSPFEGNDVPRQRH